MNRDPVRLLDDSSVPDLLREDLAEAEKQPLPSIDMAAGLLTLTAAIHAGGAGVAATGASATAKAAALAHGSWWGGALIGLGAGLLASVAIWLAPPLSRPPAPPEPAPIEAAAPLPPTADVIVAPPAPAQPSSAPRAPAENPPPTLLAPPPVASASAEPVEGPAEELALLVRIKQQAASDPAAVVALVDEGHRRFPRGSFYQERESIAILALAQLGRVAEARPRAQRFLEAHPQSPYAERLRGLAAAP
ncbi:MAG: hypothetical protein ABJE95_35165 [Byssovorax sp.]